jgi:hypothetical protein
MRRMSLRTAAARHYLGLTTTDYLVDVAHLALDFGTYSHSLGEIATFRNPALADVGPLFESAVRELGITVKNEETAIDALAESYIVSLFEGKATPAEIITEAYSDYINLLYDARQKRRDDRLFGPLVELIGFHYRLDYCEMGIPPEGETIEDINRECIRFSSEWCRDRWVPRINPDWRTSTVVSLARGINENRTFELLPILADALQDAGCENEDVLFHCRNDRLHARACWVVEVLLNAETGVKTPVIHGRRNLARCRSMQVREPRAARLLLCS